MIQSDKALQAEADIIPGSLPTEINDGLERLRAALLGIELEENAEEQTDELADSSTVAIGHLEGIRLQALALRPQAVKHEDPDTWLHVLGDQSHGSCGICAKAVQIIQEGLWHPERVDLFTWKFLPDDRSSGLSWILDNLQPHFTRDRCEACTRILAYFGSASWIARAIDGIKQDIHQKDSIVSFSRLRSQLNASVFTAGIVTSVPSALQTVTMDRPDFNVTLREVDSKFIWLVLSTSDAKRAGQIVRIAINDRDGTQRGMRFAAIRRTPQGGSYIGMAGLNLDQIAKKLNGLFTLAIFPVDLADLIYHESGQEDALGVSLHWAHRYDNQAFTEIWDPLLKELCEKSSERYRSLIPYYRAL